MKNIIKLFGIIALAAVIVFSMAACGDLIDKLTENPGPPTITTSSLPDGTVGAPYSYTISATGDAPITWSISSSLPAGLSINPSTGYISGTPSTAGTSTFTVTATNSKGSYPKQLSITILAGGGGGNVAVTNVTLTPSTLSLFVGNSVTLTYEVFPYNATNKNVAWSTSNATVATVSAGAVTARAAGSATITVTTADGGRTATCAVTVTAAGTGAKPAVPTGLKTVVQSPSKIRIDWTGNADAAGYYIYRSTTSSGNYTDRVGTVYSSNPASPSTPLAFSFTDTGLAHATRYYYKISAYNSNGESNQSGFVGETTQNIVPTSLKTVVQSPSSIRIDWTGNAEADGYYIWRSDTSGGNYTTKVGTVYSSNPASPSTPLAFSFTDTGLAHATRYYYKISAYNSYGESAQSGFIGETTQNIVPTSLKMTVVSSSSLKIEWTGNAEATGYYIYRSTTTTGNFTDRVATVPASSSSTLSYSWTDTGLAANTRYNYKISAYNSFGESAQSGYTYATTSK